MSIVIHDCPFCGYSDIEIDEVELGTFAICCPECQAIGPHGAQVMDAITAWNKATPAVTRPAGKARK